MPNPVANSACRTGPERESGSVPSTTFTGQVSDGLGRGANFVSLPGYADQFDTRLGYDPYPGTLNVTVEHSDRTALDTLDPIRIDGWEDGDRSFGAVRCYPATVRADGGVYEPAHVIVPVETDHDGETLELLAPDRIRDELDLATGSDVRVVVGAGSA